MRREEKFLSLLPAPSHLTCLFLSCCPDAHVARTLKKKRTLSAQKNGGAYLIYINAGGGGRDADSCTVKYCTVVAARDETAVQYACQDMLVISESKTPMSLCQRPNQAPGALPLSPCSAYGAQCGTIADPSLRAPRVPVG